MLHTYSLIHDDLPALDNDDLRRGRPTCHKVYGEAIAILAGDALQTQAYEVLSQLRCSAESRVRIIEEIAHGTGTIDGMIGGQVVDLEAEHTKPDLAMLEYIHRSKTAALIGASVVSGGLYAGADDKAVGKLRSFGLSIGLAFQIVDDVLDVTQTSEQLGKTAGKGHGGREGNVSGVVWGGRVVEEGWPAGRVGFGFTRCLRVAGGCAERSGSVSGGTEEIVASWQDGESPATTRNTPITEARPCDWCCADKNLLTAMEFATTALRG